MFRFFWFRLVAAAFLVALSCRGEITGIYREVFTGISGSALSDLTNSVNFPNNPSSSNLVTAFFEGPTDYLDSYGTRMRGLIIVPQTGNYAFWICSDDQGALYLSTDETPANKRLIAVEPQWNGSRDWDNSARRSGGTTYFPNMVRPLAPCNNSSNTVGTIPLVAGQRYYIEALMKEGAGGDNISVGWQLLGGFIERPIPGGRLVAIGGPTSAPPVITSQPAGQVVPERAIASFAISAVSFAPPSFQWQRGGMDIPGATNLSYQILSAAMSDSNAVFRCVVTSPLGTNVSSTAVLTVLPDVTPPTLSAVANEGLNTILVTFSEPVTATTATNILYYSVSGGVIINSISLFGSDGRTVALSTGLLALGGNYTVTVNNVRDTAATPNSIASNSSRSFTALAYTAWDVGPATVTSSMVPAGNGFDASSAGSGANPASDQFLFGYQRRSGDFDVKTRLQSLSLVDPWSSAGLMARETLATNSSYAAALATPSISGCFFQTRAGTGGPTAASGSYPVNYPDTWLRLQRAGNVFTGYASLDGQTWTILGSATLALSTDLFLGIELNSRDPARAATAQFRDLGDTVGGTVGTIPLNFEPPGPSSRRTGVIISEIMYHPTNRVDGRNLEYLELMNTQPIPEDISGYKLTGSIDATFPPNTILPGGGFIVVARVPVDVETVYGLSGVFAYSNSLPNSSGTIRLRDKSDAILLEVNYSSDPPWPAAADGAGHSLVLSRASYGEDNFKAWNVSNQTGGSPGRLDPVSGDPLRSVVINEFLAHTDLPDVDYVELFNTSGRSVDLSGCVLSDHPVTNGFIIPAGTILPARGFISFTETQLGFRLKAGGETIYFKKGDNSRVIDAVRYEAQANGVAMGRYPDGGPDFYPLAAKTPGGANARYVVGPVVINEIMFNPLSGLADDQYVELFNRSATNVDIGGWKFIAGIKYTFPSNQILNAGGYVVVAANAGRMLSNYPGLNAGKTFGDFAGALSHGGERLAVGRPDTQFSTNTSGQVVTNVVYIVEDEVTYAAGGRWGKWSDGGGSSLELIDAHSDHRRASNWADSDETRKAPWSNVEFTGTLDNGNGNYLPDSLQLFLEGIGECLVDNVEVIGLGGTNLISNWLFDNGLTNWFPQGDHDTSSLETTEGYYLSATSLHLRAGQRGDPGANRVRAPLLVPLTNLQTATLRAKVRWLKGWPEILLKLHGNYLEAPGRLSVPANLGTPGAPNSRAVSNAGPAIFDVQHFPILPAASEPVVVSARLSDPDGLQQVTLNYRIDPTSNYVAVAMRDDGTGGDAVAGDGIYSATIPGQPGSAMIAFYVQAADNALTPVFSRFPDDAPARECLVHVGEAQLASNFGTYRVWLTANTVNRWTTRDKLNNSPLDATFVYGNARVVYNAGALYSGSPWHMGGWSGPTNSLCDYVLSCPDDDRVLGSADFVLATLGNLNSDNTAQREQFAFWLCKQLGTPYDYRRYIQLYVNGVRRSRLYEDAQQPNGDMVQEFYSKDPNGDLYKIEDWFEFNDAATSFKNVDATLQDFVTTGGLKKTARYRWNFRKRALNGSADDYSRFFPLIDAVNVVDPQIFTERVEAMVDVEEWMRILAVNRIVGNWDSFGYRRGKNMYAYKPLSSRWQLMPWDIDFLLGLGDGPTTDLFSSNEPVIGRMLNHPPFRRLYLQMIQEAMDGPLQDANNGWLLDAKYSALAANGAGVTDPSAIKSFLTQRRSFLQTQLDAVNAPFGITSNGGADFSSASNVVALTGTAPLGVRFISINGAEYPITWTSVNTWVATVPLGPGTNQISVLGRDANHFPVPGTLTPVAVNYAGAAPNVAGNLFISEIMYDPVVPGASFVEIHNGDTNAIDLSYYRLDGIGYVFPAGSFIQPDNYLVLAKDRNAFASVYGQLRRVFGEFPGSLQNDGELLELIEPGTNGDLLISGVRYDNNSPWPTTASGTGASLQLIDLAQGSERVANWASSSGWQFISVTGPATSSTLYVYLDSPGDVFIDDLSLVAGTYPAVGTNLVRGGDWESGLTNNWTVSTNLTGSSVTGSQRHSGSNSLHLVSTSPGSSRPTALWQNTLPVVTNGTYTLSYWFLPTGNGSNLVIRLSGSGIVSSSSLATNPAPVLASTPGAANSLAAPLPLFASLWINEVQPENPGTIADNYAQHDPWLEIYNGGRSALVLDNYYLSDDSTYPGKWSFPSNVVLNPGQFLLVWCDGETGQSTLTDFHSNFRLTGTNGFVSLARQQGGLLQTVDFLRYNGIPAGRSFGAFPEGQALTRQQFQFVTPRGTNNPAVAAVQVSINEWMADNLSALPNPVGGLFDDWFELYNPGTNTVDLAGFYLTDTLTNRIQYRIPTGYSIPPRGYLLVWADGKPSRNSSTNADLHVNFQLSKTGEAIGLFAADGTQIDVVTFGAQTSDVSEGRYPDGAAIYRLPRGTPRAANTQPNFAPAIFYIRDYVINPGTLLAFNIVASDSNTPPQSLTYSFDPGFPTNASLSSGGFFSWMPSTAQAPSTNLFTVRVTDNGTPPLSAARSFTVVVISIPRILSVSTGSGGNFTLTWETYPGKSYRLEYADSLLNPQWTPLQPDLSATDISLSTTVPMGGSPQRFFRIIQLP